MRLSVFVAAVALVNWPAWAQERKPAPKDSVRVFASGCSRGYVFMTGPRTEDQPGAAIPEGTRLRLNAPKKMMAEIKRQEGTRIEVTGLIKKGQALPDGIGLGGGVRIGAGPAPGGSPVPSPGAGQLVIDVEGWRNVPGDCPSRLVPKP